MRTGALLLVCQGLALICPELMAATTRPSGPESGGLRRLPYNNPGLVVDLGVGLWAWPVPLDYDGDGDSDLIVICPDKPYNGTYLFENPAGKGVKFPVFKRARRLGPGNSFGTPSYVHGQLRVLRGNTEWPDFLKSGMTPGREVKIDLPWTGHTNWFGDGRGRALRVRHNVWKYVDFDGDGALDIAEAAEDWSDYGWDNAYDATGRWTNGPLHGIIYVRRNLKTSLEPSYGAPELLRQLDGRPIDGFGNPAPNFADFDGDGDLDLICGEFLDGFTYHENLGTSSAPRYAAGRRLKLADGSLLSMDLQMIVPVAFDWDQDGDLDLVVGDEDGRVAWIENTGKLAADGTPQFLAPHYFQQEADDLKCGALATTVGCDWDGDGDTDLLSGNSAGYIEFFENLSGSGVALPKWAAPVRLQAGGRIFRIMAGGNRSIQGPAEAKWGYTTLAVADWDGDDLPDILLNSILGEVMWLKNTGTRQKPQLAAAQAIEVEWTSPQPKLAWGWWQPPGRALLTQWRTSPVVYDFNHDGLPDLAMLDPEGYLVFFARAVQAGRRVLLHPRRAFLNETGDPLRLSVKSAGGSGRRKLCAVDWDGDGKVDLLANSANANFLRQTRERDGQWFFRDEGLLHPQSIEGHDVSPTWVDFDGNGVPDYVGGAEDGHFYYLGQRQTSKRGP